MLNAESTLLEAIVESRQSGVPLEALINEVVCEPGR
jgi:hypothetical protein